MCLQVQDEQFARVRVLFETGSNPGYQYKTHPNIDKQLYGSNILGNKDADRPFPTGSALPILKWRMQVRHFWSCLLRTLHLCTELSLHVHLGSPHANREGRAAASTWTCLSTDKVSCGTHARFVLYSSAS